jgi:UDP-N-acetylmuramate dehydrogenase
MARPLAELTTIRLGGPPRRLVEAASAEAIVAAVREADDAGEPVVVVAGGSNVLVADEGFSGTAVLVTSRGVQRRSAGGRELLTAQAGEPWDPLVSGCVADGLGGFECLAGIPGSVGATPIQNVGAYGQDVSETILEVEAYDRRTGALERLAPADCGFSYRSSAFKRTPGRWVILSVSFAIERDALARPIGYAELARELGVEVGERAPLGAVRDAVLRLRRGKGMVVDPSDPDSVSLGSFFTNPVLEPGDFARLEERTRERLGDGAAPPRLPEPDGRVKTSAAWLIERAGFHRGYGDPATVAISSKHTLALTNRGAGTSADLVALAREIAAGVVDRFGVELYPEPVFVGHTWAPVSAAELTPAHGSPE